MLVIVMVNIDGIYLSMIVAWVVIFLQLSVKYRRPGSVWKSQKDVVFIEFDHHSNFISRNFLTDIAPYSQNP